MNNLSDLINEHCNLPMFQAEIRAAAIAGALAAGFGIRFSEDNTVIFTDEHTRENHEDCIFAARERVWETVDFSHLEPE